MVVPKESNRIKLIIIDDHTLIRETWAQLISRHDKYEVAGTYGTADAGLEGAKALKPDIILLDINLPVTNGLEATKLFRKYVPGAKVIGISLHNQPAFAKQMFRNGAVGYITKSSTTDEMFAAFKEVMDGKRYLCQEIRNGIAAMLVEENVSSVPNLSTREIEIIRYLKSGSSSKEIAARLMLSVKTIEVHRYNILKKLKLKNTAALIDYIHKNPSFYVD